VKGRRGDIAIKSYMGTGEDFDAEQIVCTYNPNSGRYKVSFRGLLEDDRVFSMRLTDDIADSLWRSPCDVAFITYVDDQEYEVLHLNGPEKGPHKNSVIRDFMILGRAMKEYCIRKIQEDTKEVYVGDLDFYEQ